jgi:putative flippase GtrA
MTIYQRFATTLRSLLAGGAATLTDLATLAFLVSALGVAPRLASWPALLAGAVVNFVGNRSFAFRARGQLGRHVTLFTLVELASLALNAWLFDTAMRAHPWSGAHYALVRLVVCNVVFICFSYPLWTRVFRQAPQTQATRPSASG